MCSKKKHWRSVLARRAGLESSLRMEVAYTEILLGEDTIQIFTLPDRRVSAGSSQPIKWMFQIDLESVLYNQHTEDTDTKSTGAVYRLLQRTPGAHGRAMCLRSKSVVDGLVTKAEWDSLRTVLHNGVRSFTLVPVEIAVRAATVFGETDRSLALIMALGYDRPIEWDESDEDSDEEDEGLRQDDGDDGDSNDSTEHSNDRSDGGASVAATEEFNCRSDSDGEGANDVGESNGEEPIAQANGEGQQQGKKKARVTPYTLIDVTASLQRELDAFTEWRVKPINREREGVSVLPVTVVGNKADILRLLGWLKCQRNVVPSLGGVFGSDRLGVAVQSYMDYLLDCGRTFATCAGYVKSFLVVARFVYAMRLARVRNGTTISSVPVDEMVRAHRQIVQRARIEQKFVRKPKAWLDWSQILTARVRAVREYEHCKDEDVATGHKQLFDATLLVWLTSVPPDRVAVARKLQLGVTLIPTVGGGFNLDLITPDAHKTAAIFGPSTSAVPEPACRLLTAWVAAAGLNIISKPYIFVLAGRGNSDSQHTEPFGTKQWTKVVKSVLVRHAGVPVAPKDLRSSFITFMLSDANTDDALKKSVAHAMRHSTNQQSLPAYNKECAGRMWETAVRVAGEYAARF